MRFVLMVLLTLVGVGASAAAAESEPVVYRAAPSADASLPFWCDWGYEWDERCYRDLGERLPVGGEEDKVWRAALHFPLTAIAHGAAISSATLSASFDGVCLGPRKTERPCTARSYTVDVHLVLSEDWFREREVEIGPVMASRTFWAGTPQHLSWDVTDVVKEWLEHGSPNNGLLLKLADGEEDFAVSGPKLPSSEFATEAHRPTLEVRYVPPS